MNETDLEKLFDLIDKLVDDDTTWQQKRDEILQIARADERDGNLFEFLSWFEEPEV